MRRRRQIIPGVKATKLCTGLVDLSMVIDHDAVRRNNAAMRASKRAEREANAAKAELEEGQTYALLIAAWESAPAGEDKRAAIAALRAHERKHGREPYNPQVSAEGRTVDVSTGAESWLEVK